MKGREENDGMKVRRKGMEEMGGKMHERKEKRKGWKRNRRSEGRRER